MTLAQIETESDGVSVYYSGLGSDYGFYRSTPTNSAYICLNQSLLEGTSGFHLAVYQTLLTYHHTLDTWDRLVPIVKYFKALVPPEALPKSEPEIAFVGHALRLWRFHLQQSRDKIRVVGRKVS